MAPASASGSAGEAPDPARDHVGTTAVTAQAGVKSAETLRAEALQRLRSFGLAHRNNSGMGMLHPEATTQETTDRFAGNPLLVQLLKVNRTVPHAWLAENFQTKDQLDKHFKGGGHGQRQSVKEVNIFSHVIVFDLVVSLCNVPEIVVEICKHLRPIDIVRLYSVSRAFHDTINKYLKSTIGRLQKLMAPNAGTIMSWNMYRGAGILDPEGNPMDPVYKDWRFLSVGDADNVTRRVASLRWLCMVENRERIVNNVLGLMTRYGYRLPAGTNVAMLKLWMIMDVAVTRVREALISNAAWFTDDDLRKAQTMVIKLNMMLHNKYLFKVARPQSFMEVLLGRQTGWYELYMFLMGKRYTQAHEMESEIAWYKQTPTAAQLRAGVKVNGVHPLKLGVGHLEGWGQYYDKGHLMRPDELMAEEFERRGIDLASEMAAMAAYGVGPMNNIPYDVHHKHDAQFMPTLDDLYVHNVHAPDEPAREARQLHGGVGNVVCNRKMMFTPVDVRRANFATLSAEDQAMLKSYDAWVGPEALRTSGGQQAQPGSMTAEQRELLDQAFQPVDAETDAFNWDQFMPAHWWRTRDFSDPKETTRAVNAASANWYRRGVYTPFGDSDEPMILPGPGGAAVADDHDDEDEYEDEREDEDEEEDEDMEDQDMDDEEGCEDSDDDMDEDVN